jgi:hypothetical protein
VPTKPEAERLRKGGGGLRFGLRISASDRIVFLLVATVLLVGFAAYLGGEERTDVRRKDEHPPNKLPTGTLVFSEPQPYSEWHGS